MMNRVIEVYPMYVYKQERTVVIFGVKVRWHFDAKERLDEDQVCWRPTVEMVTL